MAPIQVVITRLLCRPFTGKVDSAGVRVADVALAYLREFPNQEDAIIECTVFCPRSISPSQYDGLLAPASDTDTDCWKHKAFSCRGASCTVAPLRTLVLGFDIPMGAFVSQCDQLAAGDWQRWRARAASLREPAHLHIGFALRLFQARLPWPLWSTGECDPVNSLLLGVAAPERDGEYRDNRVHQLAVIWFYC